MQNLTLLNSKEIKAFDKYKLKKEISSTRTAQITDYAILNGGYSSNEEDLKNVGKYFTNDFQQFVEYGPYLPNFIDDLGQKLPGFYMGDVGIRPAMRFSTFHSINPDLTLSRLTAELFEVDYGKYLQDSAEEELQNKLTNAVAIDSLDLKDSERKQIVDILKIEKITKTNDFYEKNERKYREFVPKKVIIYEYQRRRFAKVKADTSFFDDESFVLSNGASYKNGDSIWIEEKPIKWLINKEKDIMLSEKIIQAGIKFDYNNIIYEPEFYNTTMFNYLGEHMAQEMFKYDKILVKNRKRV